MSLKLHSLYIYGHNILKVNHTTHKMKWLHYDKFLFQPFFWRLRRTQYHSWNYESSKKEHTADTLKKTLIVSVLGEPNTGKSTLINSLVGSVVRPCSSKAHTTRRNLRATIEESSYRITFIDTPGVVSQRDKEKYKLEDTLTNGPCTSLSSADLLLVLIDASNKRARKSINANILKILCSAPSIPSILVLNKIDTPEAQKLNFFRLTRKLTCNNTQSSMNNDIKDQSEENLELSLENTSTIKTPDEFLKILKYGSKSMVDTLTANAVNKLQGWPGFEAVFLVSAFRNNGLHSLNLFLQKKALQASLQYPSNVDMYSRPEEFVCDIVKSKLLQHLYFDVPYLLEPSIQSWCLNDDLLVLEISIPSVNSRCTKQLKYPGKLKQIARSIELSLQICFEVNVKASINIKY